MPKLENTTNTDITIGGLFCPAGEGVEISEEQARELAPSLHGVESLTIAYDAPKAEPKAKPARAPITDKELDND